MEWLKELDWNSFTLLAWSLLVLYGVPILAGLGVLVLVVFLGQWAAIFTIEHNFKAGWGPLYLKLVRWRERTLTVYKLLLNLFFIAVAITYLTGPLYPLAKPMARTLIGLITG